MRLPPRHEMRPDSPALHAEQLRFPSGMGCHFLLHGIILTQESSLHLLCLLHWQVDSLPLVPPWSPICGSCSCCLLSQVWFFCHPMDGSPQAPLSMGFPRQEYWSGVPFPPPGALSDPGIAPASPAWADSVLLSHQGSPYTAITCSQFSYFLSAISFSVKFS